MSSSRCHADHFDGRSSVTGQRTRHRFVQRHAECVEIGARVNAILFQHLRRHVVQRAPNLPVEHLTAFHGHAKIHDLKPSNILVDDLGHAKSWILAWPLESRQVLDRQIRGSLHYMPPEVLKQDRVDSRADLYALGMTLYETVTGALPGYGRPSIEVIRMHLDEDIRPPSSINPRVPPELELIIMRLIEKGSRHRYPSAAALLQDVAAAAGKHADAGEAAGRARGTVCGAPDRTEGGGRATRVDDRRSARKAAGNGVIVAGAEEWARAASCAIATLRAQLEGARVFLRPLSDQSQDHLRALLRDLSADADGGESRGRRLR